jgi:hypothetical protein
MTRLHTLALRPQRWGRRGERFVGDDEKRGWVRDNDLRKENMSTTEEELQELYVWVDQIQFSRPKRNIARDFSDGVLLVRQFAQSLDCSSYILI